MHGQRRRAVAVGGVVLHEVAGRRLVERIELEPPPCVPDRERRRGRLPREPREDGAQPGRLAIALLEHPVLVEIGEERPAVQRGGGLEGVALQELVELLEIGRAPQAHAVPAGHEEVRTLGTECAAQRPGGAAERGARARVEHVGPEARGQRAAGVLPGVQREPGQQLPCAAARGLLDGAACDVGLQRAKEPHPEHVAILRRGALHGGLTVR